MTTGGPQEVMLNGFKRVTHLTKIKPFLRDLWRFRYGGWKFPRHAPHPLPEKPQGRNIDLTMRGWIRRVIAHGKSHISDLTCEKD